MRHIISATFDSHEGANRAIDRLRTSGVPDKAISVIGRDSGGEALETSVGDRPDNKATGIFKGLGVGAGVGAAFGLTALVIPGIGPFIAAGSLVETLGVIGSAAASGAIVGGAAGGLSGALMDYGVTEHEARVYEADIERGAIWVGVDTRLANVDPSSIDALLVENGGRRVIAVRSAEHA